MIPSIKKQALLTTGILLCLLSAGPARLTAQTNLLDTSTWTPGNGSAPGFNHFGSVAVNTRANATDPHGEAAVIWQGSPEEGTSHAGGWISDKLAIDHTKDYRITVWLRKTNSRNGQAQLGLYSRDELDRFTAIDVVTAENQPYAVVFSELLPELDQWYLVVGHIYNSMHLGTTVEGGVYDPRTGEKVMEARNTYRFHPAAKTLEHFSFLRDVNVNNRQDFWDPRVEEVNAQMPSIEDLLNGRDAPALAELGFAYDSSGNQRLRSRPQGSAPAALALENGAPLQNAQGPYPPGYFDPPVSGDEQYQQFLAGLAIHPNPTKGQLTADWEERYRDLVVNVTASDFSGRSVPVAYTKGGHSAQVDLQGHPSGVYLLRFELADGRQEEKKIIKE